MNDELIDESSMEEPSPCAKCGKIVELNDLAFFTAACQCYFTGRCEHGICKQCEAEIEGQVENDEVA